MTQHPGRRTLLVQAAHANLTAQERLNHIHIALGADCDEEAVLAALREAHRLHLDRRGYEAGRVIDQLIAEHTTKKADA